MEYYTFTARSYSKILLHSVKYPHCSVNGILLAQKLEKDPKKIIFVDVIPLFHLNLTLTPMMEVALSQIDSYCKSKGLIIGGYYQANEQIDDAQPNTVAVKITERIQEQFKPACLIMIDNQQITLECDQHCLNLFTLQDGKWKKSSSVEYDGDVESIAASLMHSKAFRTLVDFDNHLDDISSDWSNLHINKLVNHST